MRAIKLITAYIYGNKFDRMIIRKKLKNKIAIIKTKYDVENIRFRHLIDISAFLSIDTISEEIYDHYLKHEYNFLGLGWTNWNSDGVWCANSYRKIEWNKDIRSGYRFTNTNITSSFIKKIPQGTDIKIPWELARMQYWPQLALYGLKCIDKREQITKEFQNQMLDFIKCNPIGKGIHFFCAMEVAIRAINLMIAYDIISQYTLNNIDRRFLNIFETYIYSHLQVIINRIEKNYFTGHTGNHYLADLCGILWICMYFESPTTKKIADMVIDELRSDAKKQFTDSGSSFECSTGYHLLSAEILGLSFFAVASIDLNKLQKKDLEQLMNIRTVIDVFEARDHRIIQIGDNDSGRILKLNPLFWGVKEDCLNPMELKGMLDYVLKGNIESSYAKLLSSYHLKIKNYEYKLINNERFYLRIENQKKEDSLQEYLYKKTYLMKVELGEISRIAYISDFGLLKVICENADVYIRTVPEYERMNTAHAHDDVFSYQIITENERINEDLGSIVYTSDKVRRDFFAGAKIHGVPLHKKSMLKRFDTFDASTTATGNVLISNKIIVLRAEWDGIVHERKFEFDEKEIMITDFSNEMFDVQRRKNNLYSLGYGQLYER